MTCALGEVSREAVRAQSVAASTGVLRHDTRWHRAAGPRCWPASPALRGDDGSGDARHPVARMRELKGELGQEVEGCWRGACK